MRIEYGIGIGEDRDGQPLQDVESRIKAAVREVCLRCGGCNVVRGEGAWVDDTGRLITEPSLTIVVDVSDDFPDAGYLADDLRVRFNQTAIHVTVFPDAASHNSYAPRK